MDSDEITIAPAPTSSPIPPHPLPTPTPLSAMPETGIVAPLMKPSAQSRNGHFQAQNFTSPSGKDDELATDFTDFGFEQVQINEMMGKHELRFDSMMQRPWLQTFEDRKRERQAVQDAEKPSKGRGMKNGEKYQSLCVTEGTNWVLFDPLEGFPPQLGEPPAFFHGFAKYQPGNTKVLEYNLVNHSVRLKTTPDVLKGMAVHYTNFGPRLVEVPVKPEEPLKRARGRPRKYPVAVTGTTVGVGARAGRRKKKKKKERKSEIKVEDSESEIEVEDVSNQSLSDLEVGKDIFEVEESPE